MELHLKRWILFGVTSLLIISLLPGSYSANLKQKSDNKAGHGMFGFFRSVALLDFGLDDISAMFKNTAAAVRTVGCNGTCRTPIAFWMLQPLVHCGHVSKADCPNGLVCCFEDDLEDSSSNYFRTAITNDYQIPESDILLIKGLGQNSSSSASGPNMTKS